ncbi:MAG: UDP-N-acetylmuramate dehydrogenase [Phycisphaerae bacterium]|nr:UDP-N-acetylmuramate dehydrogenase [Phycisphaerae bacterium]
MNLFDDLPEICRRNVPLAPLTWFGLGGPAEYLIEPRTEEELTTVVRRCYDSGATIRILGFGANVLVRDEGVKGIVVRLTSEVFTSTDYQGETVGVGAGADLPRLVRHTTRRGLAGLENLAGIPGTVGGGICMNCGGRYGEIGTVVSSIRVMARDGKIHERDHDDMEFGYRRCHLGGDLVISVRFGLSEMDPGELVRRFRQVWMYKQNTQPPLGTQSVGCIFRNPNGRAAGALIDQAGLKGVRVGSAHVSDRHANFILADRGGKAADVMSLINMIRDRVEEHCGIRLEPEVQIW